jgi:D-alanyl-D-alanine carboxypeptidase
MLNDCKAKGLSPLVCSAYRTISKQEELFQAKIDELMKTGISYDEAYTAAATVVAIPGTSEHNLGLAVDICAESYQLLDDNQADTAEQQWLMEHCAEYGFILRYPQGKEDITGIIWEPWHYRYVGVELAQEITSAELCLEEYLALHYDMT